MTTRFVHVTDTHVGPDRDYRLKGTDTYTRSVALVDALLTLEPRPSFVIHTGDVATGTPTEAHYQLAAEVFRPLVEAGLPVHFVPGNHDDPDLLRRHLDAAPSAPIDEDPRRSSLRFAVGRDCFIALDCRDLEGDEESRGLVTPEQLDQLEAIFAEEWSSWTLFLHFPPRELDSPWMNPAMILRNGDALHAALRRVGSALRPVLFGHVHRSVEVIEDGVHYLAGASPCVQFPMAPAAEEDHFEPEPALPFHWITYDGPRTIVKRYGAPLRS